MCFRPSAAVANEPQVQYGECPSCGQPVAASVGITSGECPHCHKPIPKELSNSVAGTPIIKPF